MKKTAAARSIEDSALPDRVKSALLHTCAAGRSPVKTALSADPAAFLTAIAGLLARGAKALGLEESEALFVTGFNPNDAAPGRFSAALAEIQAAVFLAGTGFTGLSLIPQRAGISTDLSGEFGGETYFFEVRSIRRGGPLDYLFKKKALLPAAEAVEYLVLKYDKKVRQLNCARKRLGGRQGGVIFSLDIFCAAEESALCRLAEAVHTAKGSPALTHVCLLAAATGAAFPDFRHTAGREIKTR